MPKRLPFVQISSHRTGRFWLARIEGGESYKVWLRRRNKTIPEQWFWSAPGKVKGVPCDSYKDGVAKCEEHYTAAPTPELSPYGVRALEG